uniref:Uncharacterized protein n=1 Tax=Arundo donax TaxID=35708 RepID=A0A0A9EG66_ARUDO
MLLMKIKNHENQEHPLPLPEYAACKINLDSGNGSSCTLAAPPIPPSATISFPCIQSRNQEPICGDVSPNQEHQEVVAFPLRI